MVRPLVVVAGAWCVLAVVALPSSAGPAPDGSQAFEGKVVPLAEALKKLGEKPDADTAGMALVTADGTVYTLVKNDASRLLFLDKQLHNRDFRLTARIVPGTQMLHVDRVQTIKDGKVYHVDYWCERCLLDAKEPGACKCCGDPVVLRELPAK